MSQHKMLLYTTSNTNVNVCGKKMREGYIGWLEEEPTKQLEEDEEKIVSIGLGGAATVILLFIFLYFAAWLLLIAP